MNVLDWVSLIIAVVVVLFGTYFLSRFEVYLLIKRYNKKHIGKFDERTNPRIMSKRYRDWYVENFANMKEGYFDTEKEGNTNEK